MLLGINTATNYLSLALVENGQTLAAVGRDVGNEHSEAVFTLLETLFAWTGRPRTALTGIGVAVGPGGFTGVRTGLTVAKTLAQVLDRPVYGIDTLSALAYQMGGAGPIVPMLDARRTLVFAGVYRLAGDRLLTLTPGRLYPIEAWLDHLKILDGAPTLVGEGAIAHKAALLATRPDAWIPPDALTAAGATSVALLAGQRLAAGEPSDGPHLAPLYLREPQAVVNWDAAQAAKLIEPQSPSGV